MKALRPANVAVGLVLLAASGAVAQPAAGGEDSAAAAFAKGKRLFGERRYHAAIEALQRAYRLRPHYMVQCSIARCYENLGGMVKATEHFGRCLAEGAEKTAAAAKVRASLDAVRARITWVDVRSPGQAGTLHVDGWSAGRAPRRVALNPGRHLLEVRRKGAETARVTIETLGGEEREVTLVPKALARPTSRPIARSERPIARSDGADRHGLSQTWFWVAAGVTAALAATAVVLGVQTLERRSAYEDNPTRDRYDDAVDRRMLTNVFWAAAAVAAGGTTALFFFTDFGGSDGDGSTRVVGLGLQGRF